MAAETFALLAERYPQHPLSRPASLWLIQYYASGEAAWREQMRLYPDALPSTFGTGVGDEGVDPTLSQRERELDKFEDRLNRAAALGKQIERTNPELFAEPALRFPLAAAWRNQSSPRLAEQFYQVQSRSAGRDEWAACAAGETWLADPKGKQPKPTQRCRQAANKPKLDGRLDDEIWQTVESSPLKSALNDDEQWPAVVAFTYDAEFLYIAVSCRRAPGVKYEPTAEPRPRDADLTAQDRVDVFIDIDRDFATYYRLSFDYRGFTADSCWGDATWNPTWFVAAQLTDETWTIEAAIALDQLSAWNRHIAGVAENNTGKMPLPHAKSREIWAVGVQRTIPGVGFQSWSTPASTLVAPEGFGYLIFE